MQKRSIVIACVVALVALGAALTPASASDNSYKLTRLVSDQAGVAHQQDANLVNAWGLVSGPSTPWWVANNRSDTSTLYDGNGNPIPLIVRVTGAPTGTVFNGGTGFHVKHNGAEGPSVFLFATESGVIRGWNPNVPMPSPSTTAFKVADMSGEGAIFKGLAIAPTSMGDRLYATDFHNGRVDVFNEQLPARAHAGRVQGPDDARAATRRSGSRRSATKIVVTYAKQDANAEDDVGGRRLRVRRHVRQVREAATADRLARRARTRRGGSHGLPTNFGEFSGDLLDRELR